jgi:hypothetical protein
MSTEFLSVATGPINMVDYQLLNDDFSDAEFQAELLL